MSDDVWPLQGEAGSLSTFNAIGFRLMGLTRNDPGGRCFATRWFVVGFPLIPLQRYYVTEETTTVRAGETTTHYVIHGQSHLRIDEIVRTYLFCWLIGPAIALGPVVVIGTHADQVINATSGWVMWVGFFGSLFGGFAIYIALIVAYREHWAPVRTVRWVEGPPTPEDSW